MNCIELVYLDVEYVYITDGVYDSVGNINKKNDKNGFLTMLGGLYI